MRVFVLVMLLSVSGLSYGGDASAGFLDGITSDGVTAERSNMLGRQAWYVHVCSETPKLHSSLAELYVQKHDAFFAEVPYDIQAYNNGLHAAQQRIGKPDEASLKKICEDAAKHVSDAITYAEAIQLLYPGIVANTGIEKPSISQK